MYHRINAKKLNRTSSHRKALLKNMANSLIMHEQITTTLPKAKALRPYVEKLVTLGKQNNLASKRLLISKQQDQIVVSKLSGEISTRYQKRNGGYLRILKAGFRYGDNAPLAVIEFVERNIEAKGAGSNQVSLDSDNTKVTKKVEDKIVKPSVKKLSKDSLKGDKKATKSSGDKGKSSVPRKTQGK